MKDYSVIILAAIAVVLGSGLAISLLAQPEMSRPTNADTVSSVPSHVLWDEDNLTITTGYLAGAFYGQLNSGDSYSSDDGVVFATIDDGSGLETVNVFVSGDVLMHLDFVSAEYIGLNVTDSVGRHPVAFVVNRQTRQIETIESTAAGEYLAGAHDGQRMLMLKGNVLSSAMLDKSILREFPELKVNIPTLTNTFRPWDAAFSPTDNYIVVLGAGFVEGSEGREGERSVFWLLDTAEESAKQIGQINADTITWEDDDTFSVWMNAGAEPRFVARYSLTAGEWVKE